MLSNESPLWQHLLQDAALLALSLAFLPLNTMFLAFCWFSLERTARPQVQNGHGTAPKTILVTGVGMTKGLVLARLFAAAGDRVVGADFSPLACGRFSTSLDCFYTLHESTSNDKGASYVDSLLTIVKKEHVDLWVSCSGVASALEDGEAKEAIESLTKCKAVQYDVETTKTLHEKSSFIDHVAGLGLAVPETRTVTDRSHIEDVLSQAKKLKRRYICKCVGMDDASRGEMPLLPLSSEEATTAYLGRLNVSKQNPFIVQQFVSGREYCTHALVVRGQAKAFVACPSSNLLMHYEALPSTSPLSQAMLHFTKVVADAGGTDFTGHLSFDFIFGDDPARDTVEDVTLYPIECNPRAHTAVALFANTSNMVPAYHALLDPPSSSTTEIVVPDQPNKYYWIPHDLVCLLILRCFAWIQGRKSIDSVVAAARAFVEHLSSWKDGTFEWNDPIPWWWLYHVYWPAQIAMAMLYGRKWGRLNVSTTKIFMC